jgi:hypothetical protein
MPAHRLEAMVRCGDSGHRLPQRKELEERAVGPSILASIAEEEETTRFVNQHFENVKIGAVLRLMTVCLQRQLEKLIVTWSWIQAHRSVREEWSVRLLGERNDCLKQLQLFCIDVCDVGALGCFSALEQIDFYDCNLTLATLRPSRKCLHSRNSASAPISRSWIYPRFTDASRFAASLWTRAICGQQQHPDLCPDPRADVPVS